MHQHDVDRAVAQASGESVATISRRGFVLLTPTPQERESSTREYEALLARFGTAGSEEDPIRERSASLA